MKSDIPVIIGMICGFLVIGMFVFIGLGYGYTNGEPNGYPNIFILVIIILIIIGIILDKKYPITKETNCEDKS